MKLLEKTNNVDQECLDFDEQDLSELKTWKDMERNDDLFTTDELKSSDSNNEKENINKRREQKKRKLLLFWKWEWCKGPTYRLPNDWEEIDEGSKPGRTPVYNIFREVLSLDRIC